MTLTEFLLARIDEDETMARTAVSPWRNEWTSEDVGVTMHIERHDPARVLAECKARRRIVAAFEDERIRKDIYNRGYDDGLLTTSDDMRQRWSSNARWAGLEIAARALALPYADHPDYDETWRP